MRRDRTLQRATIVLTLVGIGIASYLTYYVIRPGGRANYATLIEPQRPLPAVEP